MPAEDGGLKIDDGALQFSILNPLFSARSALRTPNSALGRPRMHTNGHEFMAAKRRTIRKTDHSDLPAPPTLSRAKP